MKPKYPINTQVYYPRLRAHGTIVAIINLGDKEDIRRQGYRYEVEFRKTGLWSLPESLLGPKISGNLRTSK